MRDIRFLLFVLLLPMLLGTAQGQGREVWNRDWEFRFEDEPLKGKEREWHCVHLPHSFSIPYFMSDAFYTGRGTYRKTLNVKPEWLNKRVVLEFEAAFQVAEVRINGHPVTRHEGGYTAFIADLSPHVKAGANVVEVTVDNRWNPRIAPRAGEHTFSGGLYRNVYLYVTDHVHISQAGVWARTKQIGKTHATVLVQTELKNDSPHPKTVTLTHEALLLGVQRFKHAPIRLNPGEHMTVSDEIKIKYQRLWQAGSDEMNSFFLQTRLEDENGAVLDETINEFGLRTVELTADRGLLINGNPVYLRGVNVHQDHAGWGDAVTNRGAERDVKLMKEAGFNFIRCSHYPHSQAFLNACDRTGMAVMCEGIFWGMGGFKENDTYWNCDAYPDNPDDRAAFEESCMRQVREMVIQNRNHPSIIAWSISNEPFFTRHTAGAKALCEKLIKLVKELDPTRPVCVGGGQRGGFDKLGDFAAFNGDGAQFKTPGRPSMVSEYGSVSCKRPGEFAPGWGDLSRDKAAGNKYPWRFGEAIWCGFDHGSIWPSGGRMGIVDYFRVPKRAWYWYRKQYRGITPPAWPVKGTPARLLLSADKRTIIHPDGRDDVLLTVKIADADGVPLANEAPVTLSVVSGPGEFPTGKSITFTPGTDIDLIEGCAAIEFRSYYVGKTIIRATSLGLKSAEVALESIDIQYELSAGATMPVPHFILGKSRETLNRPYKRFTAKASTATPANLATLRPCSVSSNRSDASFAADGNPGTAWTPDKTDQSPYWQLDMEFEFSITAIKTQGDFNGNPPAIQTSLDAKTWSPWNGKARARYIRIHLHPGQSLSEVEVN